MYPFRRIALVIFLAAASGCARSPVAPAAAPAPTDPATQAASDATLTISDFKGVLSLAGDTTVVIPEARFAETGGVTGLVLQEVSFQIDGVNPPLTVHLSARIPPGGALTFTPGAQLQLPPGARALRLTARFRDDRGIVGTATAETPLPMSHGPSDAVISISRFEVFGSRLSYGDLDYIPVLSLTETGGRSAATITRVSFTLLDIPHGAVPPWTGSAVVPAGGTRDLLRRVGNEYGEPDFEITNKEPAAARVGVIVSFADEAGRLGSVSAIAAVVR